MCHWLFKRQASRTELDRAEDWEGTSQSTLGAGNDGLAALAWYST